MHKSLSKHIVNEPNKIYFLGSRGVGKSSLCRVLCEKEFSWAIKPSPFKITIMKLNKGKHSFTLKDLTDNSDFKLTKILLNEIADVKCIFILFSIIDYSSFEYAKNLIAYIYDNVRNINDILIYLIGNKSDLTQLDPNLRQVNLNEVNDYISNCIPSAQYLEISCSNKYNINSIVSIINDIEINNEEEESEDEDDDKKNIDNNESYSGSCNIC